MAVSSLHSLPLVLTPEALEGKAGDLRWELDCLITAVLGAGFGWDDLPADLRAIYALGYYSSNILNGGHSQFIHNAFNFYHSIGPLPMLGWASEAAARFGMTQTQGVIADVLAWVVANPDEASRQTGFSGGRAPALDPLDTRFYHADLLPEADWLATLNPLGADVALRLARGDFYQHADHPLRFPTTPLSNHVAKALMTRQPRCLVAKDAFADTIAQLVRNLPGARDQLLALAYPKVVKAIPSAQDCAVMQALEKADHWRDTPPMAGLSLGQSAKEIYSVWRSGKSEYLIAKADRTGTVIVEAAIGSPFSLGRMLRSPPRKPVTGVFDWLRRYFDPEDRKQRRWRAALARQDAQSALRPVSTITKGSLAEGSAIADMAHTLHLPEALALYLVETGEVSLLFRRLLWWAPPGQTGQDWRMITMKDTPVDLQARADGVTFRTLGSETLITFPLAQLQALREKLASENLFA